VGSSENYSIQALNLIDGLIADYELTLKSIRRDDVTIKELKKLRFSINNRLRKISDIAEIKNDHSNNCFKLIVFNEEYNELIFSELDELKLEYKLSGQFIIIKKPKYNFNQLMTIVDDVEKKKNRILSKCMKAKLDPVMRAKNALENEFIDIAVQRETSNNCQKIFEQKEERIDKITLEKIKMLLGKEFFDRYLEENS
tara:strand:+ start:17 stop:610 length:594 start_codon:yes stop_codon:yes gene_type:complete